MSKFYVGQRVRIVQHHGTADQASFFVGKRGTVMDVWGVVNHTHMVRIDEPMITKNGKQKTDFLFYPDELDPLT